MYHLVKYCGHSITCCCKFMIAPFRIGKIIALFEILFYHVLVNTSNVIHSCDFSGTGTTVWLPQCQWSNPEKIHIMKIFSDPLILSKQNKAWLTTAKPIAYQWHILCTSAPLFQCYYRADSRFAPSQWETALLCNNVSHWLGASLESVLLLLMAKGITTHIIINTTYSPWGKSMLSNMKD